MLKPLTKKELRVIDEYRPPIRVSDANGKYLFTEGELNLEAERLLARKRLRDRYQNELGWNPYYADEMQAREDLILSSGDKDVISQAVAHPIKIESLDKNKKSIRFLSADEMLADEEE